MKNDLIMSFLTALLYDLSPETPSLHLNIFHLFFFSSSCCNPSEADKTPQTPLTQVYQLLIVDIPTNIVISKYSNLIEIMVTQTNGVGTVVHAYQNNANSIVASSPTYSVDVKLHSRDSFIAEIIARRLIETISKEDKSVILMCCLKIPKQDPSQPKAKQEYDDFGDLILGPYHDQVIGSIIETLQKLLN